MGKLHEFILGKDFMSSLWYHGVLSLSMRLWNSLRASLDDLWAVLWLLHATSVALAPLPRLLGRLVCALALISAVRVLSSVSQRIEAPIYFFFVNPRSSFKLLIGITETANTPLLPSYIDPIFVFLEFLTSRWSNLTSFDTLLSVWVVSTESGLLYHSIVINGPAHHSWICQAISSRFS